MFRCHGVYQPWIVHKNASSVSIIAKDEMIRVKTLTNRSFVRRTMIKAITAIANPSTPQAKMILEQSYEIMYPSKNIAEKTGIIRNRVDRTKDTDEMTKDRTP